MTRRNPLTPNPTSWGFRRPLFAIYARIYAAVNTLQPDPSVVVGELPVDLGLNPVPSRLPSGDLGAQHFEGVNAVIQALADHHIELDLGDVQPTAVLGGEDELEAVPQGLQDRVSGLAGEGRHHSYRTAGDFHPPAARHLTAVLRRRRYHVQRLDTIAPYADCAVCRFGRRPCRGMQRSFVSYAALIRQPRLGSSGAAKQGDSTRGALEFGRFPLCRSG